MEQPKNHNLEPLLTLDDLRRILSVSASTVYRGVKAGTFPTQVRLGGRVAWKSSDITAWLADRERGTGQTA